MQKFWDDLAKDGSWSSHYKGDTDLNTYNFYTRREAVSRLLQNDGGYQRILDVGCGTGDYLNIARDHHADYFGIDYAFHMISKAKSYVDRHGKRDLVLTGDGLNLPYRDASFDLVLAMGYIEYFDKPDLPLSEIMRVMQPGGTLVIQSFKKEFFGYFDQYMIRPLRSLLNRGNGTFHPPSDWIDKKYSQQGLDVLMRKHGFLKEDSVFNNFHVFPGMLRTRYPGRYIRMSESITASNPSLWRFLAVNYIGKYILKSR